MNDQTEKKPPRGRAINEPLERQVYDGILARILTGDYKLGEKLPSENVLAKEYSVSRPVLRTALSRLRDDRLLVSRQGAGSFVGGGGIDDERGFTPLQGIEDIASYISFRKLIEAEAAARAATNANAQALSELRAILEELDGAIDAGNATLDLDQQFHFRIAELSDNRFLVETLKMLRPYMYFVGTFLRSLGSTGYLRGKRSMTSEHYKILDAIEAKDADAARKAVIEHFDASERRVFKGE